MTPTRFMVIAGEASGDMLAAELVRELRAGIARQRTYANEVQPLRADLAPRFFGAGGRHMAEAGVELAFDLTQHSMTGLPGPKRFLKFYKLLNQLVELACDREPHVIICVDFQAFNSSFAAKIRKRVNQRRGTFNNWQPKIVKYISGQVWASRPDRAYNVARDVDLLLSIFPFEKEWYSEKVPRLRVEFVGHPLIERHGTIADRGLRIADSKSVEPTSTEPLIALLPGSRPGELERHLPPMVGALKIMQAAIPNLRAKMVLPNESLVTHAKNHSLPANLEIRCGDLAETLRAADLAIASTGTVTMECAYFGVPTITLYKTFGLSLAFRLGIITTKWLTMPNILADEELFPEFLQNAATPENFARAALELLRDPARRERIRQQLAVIIASLGQPGATRRAADLILSL